MIPCCQANSHRLFSRTFQDFSLDCWPRPRPSATSTGKPEQNVLTPFCSRAAGAGRAVGARRATVRVAEGRREAHVVARRGEGVARTAAARRGLVARLLPIDAVETGRGLERIETVCPESRVALCRRCSSGCRSSVGAIHANYSGKEDDFLFRIFSFRATKISHVIRELPRAGKLPLVSKSDPWLPGRRNKSWGSRGCSDRVAGPHVERAASAERLVRKRGGVDRLLYEGQPNRTTACPTAGRCLKAINRMGITATRVDRGRTCSGTSPNCRLC